jgi:hypothetical protein
MVEAGRFPPLPQGRGKMGVGSISGEAGLSGGGAVDALGALRHEEEAFERDVLLAGDADAELRVVDSLEGGFEAREFFASLVERSFGDALVLHGVEATQTTDGFIGGDGCDDFIEVGDALFGIGDFFEEAIFELLESFGRHYLS